MPTDILMPALSPTMEEGKLAKWLVKEGDSVKSGDILAEIETDKATMEFEAVDEGRIEKILVPEGTEGVKVNQPIAVLAGGDGAASAAPVREEKKDAPAPKQDNKTGTAAAHRQNTGPAARQNRRRARSAGGHRVRHHDGARSPARCHGRGNAPR